jgi:ERCC4-type nuclease
MSQNKLLHIIIDNREQKLKAIFDQKKDIITYESKQLDIADVIISEDIAIERKEGFDFIASIMDNRLFEQVLRLKDTYTDPILILEGMNDEVFENTGMNIKSIYGALSFEQVKDSTPILSRKAPKEMSKKERRTFIIEGLVDIGPKKARALIDKYKTPHQVFKAIKHTEILYTKTGNPKGIRGPLENLSGFGWKFVEKNKKLLFGKKKRDPQKKINQF